MTKDDLADIKQLLDAMEGRMASKSDLDAIVYEIKTLPTVLDLKNLKKELVEAFNEVAESVLDAVSADEKDIRSLERRVTKLERLRGARAS